MGIDVQTPLGYEVVNNGITYTLGDGFIFDEINSSISVSDGDYNKLTNVPNKEISCYQISITSDIRDTYPSWSIFSYRASDRTMAYNTSTLYDNRATTAQYASANTTMKNILYYNHGDQILFKNYISGSADYYETGVDPETNEPYTNYNLFSLYRVDASVTAIDPDSGINTGTGFYRQFTWINNQLRDWRKNNIDPTNYYYTEIGAYGDSLIYTLEAGYKYVLIRRVAGVDDTPLWIYVNNPVQDISTSYTPISGTIIHHNQ
jgi:hypothetical protein